MIISMVQTIEISRDMLFNVTTTVQTVVVVVSKVVTQRDLGTKFGMQQIVTNTIMSSLVVVTNIMMT
jgi:hypothetical protein